MINLYQKKGKAMRNFALLFLFNVNDLPLSRNDVNRGIIRFMLMDVAVRHLREFCCDSGRVSSRLLIGM